MNGWNDYNEDEARRDPAVRLRPALQAAIEDAKPALLARFASWREIPRLQSSSTAFEARMEAVTTGKKARVDFKRTFARFIKDRFPDFPVAIDTGEHIRCVKPLDEKLALGIDWHHKHAWGLGKMLEVQVGARWETKTAMSFHSLPAILGSSELAAWAYITKEDLEACFEGAAQFLDTLLPVLTEWLPKHMADGVNLGGAGAIGAREGHDIARRLLDGILSATYPAGSASAMELQTAGVVPGTGRRWGAPFSPDGRLRAHGMWGFSFKGSGGDGARINVPSLGAPSVAYQTGWALRGDPIGEPWMDSTDAMAAIAGSGRMLEDVVPVEVTLGFYPPDLESPCWRFDSWVLGKGVRNVVLVDARDGHLVWAHP